ncbi:hypothetical protein [Cupriavidus pauculus]|uniref:hypothetical protein n=1 Tax=Cupriavidus pauculus TaxID=82633 RepID=UPI001FD0890E|nr:hypothetical protein [Cupriavidus pauculus]
MALELRFYNGRQLSEHEQKVIARYQDFLKTTKLADEIGPNKAPGSRKRVGAVKKPAEVKRIA